VSTISGTVAAALNDVLHRTKQQAESLGSLSQTIHQWHKHFHAFPLASFHSFWRLACCLRLRISASRSWMYCAAGMACGPCSRCHRSTSPVTRVVCVPGAHRSSCSPSSAAAASLPPALSAPSPVWNSVRNVSITCQERVRNSMSRAAQDAAVSLPPALSTPSPVANV